jgi:hypothetical protein
MRRQRPWERRLHNGTAGTGVRHDPVIGSSAAGTHMDIHFVSTLTPEDEDRYAPVVLAAARAILDQMNISYAVRIVTTNGTSVQHTRADTPAEGESPVLGRRAGPRLVSTLTRSSA